MKAITLQKDSPMTRETLERMARDLATEFPLHAEDWQAIVDQVEVMLGFVHTLDELPLENVEPTGSAATEGGAT